MSRWLQGARGNLRGVGCRYQYRSRHARGRALRSADARNRAGAGHGDDVARWSIESRGGSHEYRRGIPCRPDVGDTYIERRHTDRTKRCDGERLFVYKNFSERIIDVTKSNSLESRK